MAMSLGYGVLFAIISLLCNGSFSSLNKLPSVMRTRIDPQIFNVYFITGTVASCMVVYLVLLALGETVTITYLGVISGFLLSLAGITTFAAIGHIGLSVGVAIWSGTAVLVSFTEGLLVNPELFSWGMSIVGVIVLIVGIITVSFSELFAQLCCGYVPQDVKRLTVNESEELLSPTQSSKAASTVQSEDMDSAGTTWFLGIFYAILTGILGGSVGFPSMWTDSTNSDTKYLISFAIGASVVFPLTAFTQCLCRENPSEEVRWHFSVCFIPGFFAGVIWNAGNLASLYAINVLGYAVAYPIMQSSLMIASIWGVFVWKEYRDKHVILFIFVGAITVVLGCALITFGIDG